MMAAAWLDDSLEFYLRRVLSRDQKVADQLFGFDRPLGSFGARIKLAYLLGMISDEVRRDLDTIRTIRNDLAHVRYPISTNCREFRERCRTLSVYRRYAAKAPKPSRQPKQQFVVSAYLLAMALLSQAEKTCQMNDAANRFRLPTAAKDEVMTCVEDLVDDRDVRRSLSLFVSE